MRITLEEPFKSLWKKAYLRIGDKDNRKRVDLVNDKYDRTTISYARYLMCIEIGEILSSEYEVDHIDKNKTNDLIQNLQILLKEDHHKKTSQENKGRTYVEFICPCCNSLFKKEKRLIKKEVPNPKCSRRCNGLMSKNIKTLHTFRKTKGVINETN